ncbi:MAG TPA: hypothetical protein VGH73_00985 [Thermoanaerobaculia bacterium]
MKRLALRTGSTSNRHFEPALRYHSSSGSRVKRSCKYRTVAKKSGEPERCMSQGRRCQRPLRGGEKTAGEAAGWWHAIDSKVSDSALRATFDSQPLRIAGMLIEL